MEFKITHSVNNNVQDVRPKAKPTEPVSSKQNFAHVLSTYLLADSTENLNDSVSVEFPEKSLHTLRTLLGSVNLKGSTEVPTYANVMGAYGTDGSNSLTAQGSAQQIARNITRLYEGGGVSGNFDGQGLSLGYLQWNIGSNTLQPLLRDMANSPETKSEFDEIFAGKTSSGSMADDIRQMLNMNSSQQLAWARSINNSQNKIKEPWKSAFNELTQSPSFLAIQDKYATPYFSQANKIVNDPNIGVNTVRGYTLAFDIAVQNGSIKSSARNLILGALSGENNPLTNPNDPSLSKNQRDVVVDLNQRLKSVSDPETRKLYYTAAAVAITSRDQYAKDVWSRKATIVAGNGRVHGQNLALNAAGLSDERLT